MTEPRVIIARLAEHRPLIATLAGWHHGAWGGFFPQWTLEFLTAELAASARQAGRPISWVALVDGAPAGTVSLFDDDIPQFHDHGPWLANVFVAPEYRRLGLGRRLVDHAVAAAHDQGVGELFLFTHDQAAWYRRLGWRDVAQPSCWGRAVQVMARSTAPNDMTGNFTLAEPRPQP